MRKTKLACASVLFLLIVFTITLTFPPLKAEINLGVGDLPGFGGNLNVTENTTLTINEGETATFDGAITVQPDVGFAIVNNGDFTLNATVQCTTANFTVENTGNLTLQNGDINLEGYALFNLANMGTLTATDYGVNVYNGSANIFTNGTLTAHNLQLKDQNDGITFANNGDATLANSSFVANGALGIHNMFNNGNLTLIQSSLDANYGGTINLNSLFGTTTFNACTVDASGASHGKTSTINMLTGQTTWISTSINSNSGSISYSNYGAATTMQNCVFNNIANYQNVDTETMTDSNITNLNNYLNAGNTTFTNCRIISLTNYNNNDNAAFTNCTILNLNNYLNAGNANFTSCNITDPHNIINNGNLTVTDTSLNNTDTTTTTILNAKNLNITDSPFTSNKTININNQGALYADGWMLKTANATSTINLTNDENITFTQPFIEGVSSETLLSLDATPTVFTQTSGGNITVTNNGLIQQAQESPVIDEVPITEIWLAGTAALLIIALTTTTLRKKKTRADHRNSRDCEKPFSLVSFSFGSAVRTKLGSLRH